MKKSLRELAEATQTTFKGDPEYLVTGVAPLDSAEPCEVSFFSPPMYASSSLYASALKLTRAGVICVGLSTDLVLGKNYLISQDPSMTFQKIVELFSSKKKSGFQGIHPTVVVHPTAEIGEDVTLGPYVVVDAHCKVGRGTVCAPFVTLAHHVEVGVDCLFHSHVAIREECRIGNRVIIQPHAVIGSCGFGYKTDSQGVHHKQEQLGIVVIEDEVEIGAGTTIDRARFQETRIGFGSKIDNLVQVAHNVSLGRCNLVVSLTGISGSVKTGQNVVMGGQTGIVGHVELGDGVLLAARSGVRKSIPDAGKYGGDPLAALDQSLRRSVFLSKWEIWVQRLKNLERKVSKVKNSKEG